MYVCLDRYIEIDIIIFTLKFHGNFSYCVFIDGEKNAYRRDSEEEWRGIERNGFRHGS